MSETAVTNDLDTLLDWKGRSESSTDVISAANCRKLQDTLDLDHATISDGDVLPPLWHFIGHIGSVPMHRVGPDGHPKRGGFLPPVALPRRMWAAGRVRFAGDLHVGDEVVKTSTIENVAIKEGRSGTLCFVTVRHDLTVGGDLRISEEQDLVYRDHPDPDALTPEPKPAPTEAAFSRTITPNEVLLFRYSALTFNGHRIHYDRPYAQAVEGYPDLVVHGPLTATLLADLAAGETGRQLASFSFRAMSPLFVTDPFTISGSVGSSESGERGDTGDTGDTVELWATTPSGGLAMKATAELR